MKGMKGRLLKKIKSFPHVAYLKPDRVLHVHASDALFDATPCKILSNISASEDNDSDLLPSPNPLVIDVDELMKDLKDDDEESGYFCDKENIRPPPSPTTPTPWKKKKKKSEDSVEVEEKDINSERDELSYRLPDLNSSTLFDPDLLAAFRQAVMEHTKSFEEAKNRTRVITEGEEDVRTEKNPPFESPRTPEDYLDPLAEFEERCPPGGSNSVVLYTTTLRGIRKTFEDCNSVRFLLESSKVLFFERDVSMHLEFREELWRVLECRAIPPRLFIKGRYIGGADEVLGLHEQGKLLPLLQGMPVDELGGELCQGCGGIRFLMCSECKGSHKVYDTENVVPIQCHRCNENGLVLCPICCCCC